MNIKDLIKQALETEVNRETVLQGVTEHANESASKLPRRRVVSAVALLVVLTLLAVKLPTPFSGGNYTILTSYASGVDVELKPGIEVGAAHYSMAMSVFPGFPFMCQGDGVESVEYKTDNGGFVDWTAGIVTHVGKQTTAGNGATVYWVPWEPEQSAATLPAEALLELKIRMASGRTFAEEIEITSYQPGAYKAFVR